MRYSPCFGVELGVSTTAIGHVRNGVPELIQIDEEELVPSAVCFTPDEDVYIGHPALAQVGTALEHTVLGPCRRLGAGRGFALGQREVSAEQLCALQLMHLLDGAAAACGRRPERVVIAIPSNLGDVGRRAVIRAAAMAKVEAVEILDMATAVALSLGRDRWRHMLVVELGVGEVGVSALVREGPDLHPLATWGVDQLHDEPMEARWAAQLTDALARSRPALHKTLLADRRDRVRLAVEMARVQLVDSAQVSFSLPLMVEGEHGGERLDLRLRQDDLHELLHPVLSRACEGIDGVLRQANLRVEQLDGIVLVGNLALLPQVRTSLRASFGLEGRHVLAPQRAAALGATIRAAVADLGLELFRRPLPYARAQL